MRVDLNPLQSGGSANLTNLSGWKKVAMMMVSFGAFFAIMNAGQATIQPIAESVLGFIPGVKTSGGRSSNDAWGW